MDYPVSNNVVYPQERERYKMRHQLRSRTSEDRNAAMTQTSEQLTPEQFAAYLRQSTTKQVENNLESADLQLSGAQRYAVSQGLQADKIVVAHEGNGQKGVSGTLRIDQREKLQEIMAGIERGTIKVVWAYSVSRLFRDKYGVQVGTFVEMCAKHGVKVVIETAQTFDFRDQMHVMIFNILANVAAKENDDRTRLMQAGKQNKAMRGEYHGRPLTPGYIIDRDKKSPSYGKYIPYAPHAQVTASLYARYRQLNGAFNVLASEVARMPFVFPDFELWVDQRDVHQFRLKKVPGGYTMGAGTLRNLLTAIEVVGYWKVVGESEKIEVARTKDTAKGTKGTTYPKTLYLWDLLTDETGAPKINHEPIVPMGDFMFAFNRLSWYTLEGKENKARHNAHTTWTPVKRDRQEPLLCGLLTTPNGTVQYSKGVFRVMELRPGHHDRSATLQVESKMVDALFMDRLQDKYLESGMHTYDKIIEELIAVREQNAKSLVSVDQQIAGYEKSIANKQAVLAALGDTMDVPTMRQYNQDIKDDRANLDDAAAVQESQLLELHQKIDQVLMGESDREVTRRFIKLATDRIELTEYSAHFAKLTVYWSSPFAQVDVCYIWLAESVHEAWTETDTARLRELYPAADRLELLQAFPTRSWSGILSYANVKGMSRDTNKNSIPSLPIQLSLKDQEVIDLLGFNPSAGYLLSDAWVNDVSSESL
jgi:DNA invertase Pin-like site-specific DNA recombinase